MDEQNIQSRWTMAMDDYISKDYDSALRTFKAIQSEYRRGSHAIPLSFNLGLAHLKVRQYSQAIAQFEKCLDQPDLDIFTDYLLGVSHQRNDYPYQAIDHFKKCLKKLGTNEKIEFPSPGAKWFIFRSDLLVNLSICFHLISDQFHAASYLAQAKAVNDDPTTLHPFVEAIMTEGFEGFSCIVPPSCTILPFDNLLASKVEVAKPLKSTPLIEKPKAAPVVIPARKQSLDANATSSRESYLQNERQSSKTRRESMPAIAKPYKYVPFESSTLPMSLNDKSFEMDRFMEAYEYQAPQLSPNDKRFGKATIHTVEEEEEEPIDSMLKRPASSTPKACITNLADFEKNLMAKSKKSKTTVPPLTVIADQEDDAPLLTPPEKDEIPVRMASRVRDTIRTSSIQSDRDEKKLSHEAPPSPVSGNEASIYEGPLMMQIYGVWKRCYGVIKSDHLLILESKESMETICAIMIESDTVVKPCHDIKHQNLIVFQMTSESESFVLGVKDRLDALSWMSKLIRVARGFPSGPSKVIPLNRNGIYDGREPLTESIADKQVTSVQQSFFGHKIAGFVHKTLKNV